MLGFDFEEERIKQEITKLGAKRVLLQLPEGLKPEAPRIARIVEKAGALPIISADPCYGACDIAVAEAESLGVDLIVHFGHARMVNARACSNCLCGSQSNSYWSTRRSSNPSHY